MLLHPWPLNFRELHQAVASGIALASDGVLDLGHFPRLQLPPQSATKGGYEVPSGLAKSPSDHNAGLRAQLVACLREHRGNVSAVARTMGKAPIQVYRWMARFELDPRDFRREEA
jgi:transcriptional regulator of acetoin/glycerol metabolism